MTGRFGDEQMNGRLHGRPGIELISVLECRQLLDQYGPSANNASRLVILDVRTEEEHRSGHIPGSLNLNFRSASFARELDRLERGRAYLLYCRTGVRSARAAALMLSLGFGQIYDLGGGIAAWLREGFPVARESAK